MDINKIILEIAAVLMAITLHEVAHGYVAFRLGDPTAKFAGRLTLNPIKHLDPFGSVILPLMLALTGGPLFGWAKPVPVNFRNFRDIKNDTIKVSGAGVAVNLACALAGGFLVRLILKFGPVQNFILYEVLLFLCFFVFISAVLGVLNLIPVPPLDGGRILTMLLPPRAAIRLERAKPVLIIGVLILMITGKLWEILFIFLWPILSLALGQDGLLFLMRTAFSA